MIELTPGRHRSRRLGCGGRRTIFWRDGQHLGADRAINVPLEAKVFNEKRLSKYTISFDS
jgi:hypothetical protein